MSIKEKIVADKLAKRWVTVSPQQPNRATRRAATQHRAGVRNLEQLAAASAEAKPVTVAEATPSVAAAEPTANA